MIGDVDMPNPIPNNMDMCDSVCPVISKTITAVTSIAVIIIHIITKLPDLNISSQSNQRYRYFSKLKTKSYQNMILSI